jgi:hypothetical protein
VPFPVIRCSGHTAMTRFLISGTRVSSTTCLCLHDSVRRISFVITVSLSTRDSSGRSRYCRVGSTFTTPRRNCEYRCRGLFQGVVETIRTRSAVYERHAGRRRSGWSDQYLTRCVLFYISSCKFYQLIGQCQSCCPWTRTAGLNRPVP